MNTKEAIERIKTRFDKWALDDEDMKAIQTLIPELAESEDDDEGIRKLLVWQVYRNIEDETNDLAGSVYDGIKGHDPDLEESIEDWKKCLAWLEKQKYNRLQPVYDNQESFESALDKAWKAYNESGSRTVDSCEDDYIECAHAKGFREGYLFGLEKQKEQKPCWNPTEEDVALFNKAITTNVSLSPQERAKLDIIRMKFKHRPVIEQKEQKPKAKAKSPLSPHELYDVKIEGISQGRQDVLDHPEQFGLQKPVSISCGHENDAEWSDEDADMLNCCISSVEEAKENRYAYNETDGNTSYDREIAWLKSLRPSWKPSEMNTNC